MSRTIQGSQTGSIQLNPVRGGHDSVGWEMGGGMTTKSLGLSSLGAQGIPWAELGRAEHW